MIHSLLIVLLSILSIGSGLNGNANGTAHASGLEPERNVQRGTDAHSNTAVSSKEDFLGNDLPINISSVVLLSAEGQSCATGFFVAPDTILTNLHVSESVCPFGSCPELKIHRAAGTNRLAREAIQFKSADGMALTATELFPSI
jgi:hypothetical protein